MYDASIVCRLKPPLNNLYTRCSMKNIEVLNNTVTEEDVHHDSAPDASSCSVPIVRINSEIHDTTEPTNLLVEGTFVDMILTTLPVTLYNLPFCFLIYFSCNLYV